MTTLTILYDRNCDFCRRCRDWLNEQPAHLRFEFLAAQSPEVEERFPGTDARDSDQEPAITRGFSISGPFGESAWWDSSSCDG